MTLTVTYPGVYIQEFTPGAPIQGVGTSTAGFLGPSSNKGEASLNEPIKITNWDAFLRMFGDAPLDGFYMWYAVRGFFENGGQVCYVTRVSNASYETHTLTDQNGAGTIRLRARWPGDLIPDITVTVDDTVQVVANATLFKPEATVQAPSTGTSITVTDADDASDFRPGDEICIQGGTDVRTVTRVAGTTINIDNALNVNAPATVRLADRVAGSTSLRVENAAGLAGGSVVSISQVQGAVTREETAVVKGVIVENLPSGTTTYRVELEQSLANDYRLAPADNVVEVSSFEFSLRVVGQHPDTGPYDVTFPDLSMRPEHPNYYRAAINDDPDGIIRADPVEPPNTTAPPDNRPGAVANQPLSGGGNDNPAGLTATDYINALRRLEAVDDVNFIAIPDRTDPQVQQALRDHCERMHDRFAILDTRRNADPFLGPDSADAQLNGVQSQRGFVALYYPWLRVRPAAGNDPILVPPSGHVAGIYARIDQTRGVHKAPAGNEAGVRGALGVATVLSDVDQGELNKRGVNVIRLFASGGQPIVWGARTTAVERDTNWQYVNVRRLFLFLEESIEEGIRWAVFEPNNLQLWQKLKRTITEFLTRVWRDGALFGKTPEEAFYVRIDEVLNPFSEQQLGRLNIEIGVRPTYPAEFIIVRIGIWAGGSDVNEP